MQPLVSVVLPVYNGELFLAECVRSIRDQQGFYDFEVIVIDDGSTDRSFEILEAECDERFLLLRQKQNRGLITGLNIGCRRAQGKYIARMDADDIMLPDRLVSQFNFMERNPLIAVSGGYFDYINEDGETVGDALKFPVQPIEVKEAFKTYCAIGHPTAFIRREALFALAPGLYPRRYPHAEDLGLWLEMLSKGAHFANLPKIVLHYRQHSGQVAVAYKQLQAENTARVYADWKDKIWEPAKIKLRRK